MPDNPCTSCPEHTHVNPDDLHGSCEVGVGSVTERACPMVQPRLGFSSTTTGNSVPHLVGDAIVQCSITETTMENGVQVTRGRDGTAELLQLRQERDELDARLKQSESAAQNIDRQWSDRHRALVQVLERAEAERDAALARNQELGIELDCANTTILNLQSALVAAGHEPDCPVVHGASPDCVVIGECVDYRAKAQELEASAAAMRTKLEFYANQRNYIVPSQMGGQTEHSLIDIDHGERAIAALASEAGRTLLAERERLRLENCELKARIEDLTL
jgi:hypothetical protein